MFKKLILAVGLALALASPAETQNTTCSNRPEGDASNACANTRFVRDNGTGVLDWYIVGTTDYPTVQSAVDAAAATGVGGTIFVPCGTWPLGSGAVGLDVDAQVYIRITGNGGFGGGSNQCTNLQYTGTGTAISAKGTSAFVFDHIYLFGTSAAKLIDFTTGSLTNTVSPYIHDATLVGLTGTTVLVDAASTTDLRINRTLFAGGSVGIRGITSGGGLAAGQFFVNANISDNNSFQPSLTLGAISGLQTATVQGNVFQGQLNALITGPALTCQVINWIGNWHGDSVTPQNLIQSNCNLFNSIGNLYSAGTGIAITQDNSTGTVSSFGDSFSGANPWIAIGTGNFLDLGGVHIGAVPIITGTPNVTSVAARVLWGALSLNVATGSIPLSIGALSSGTAVQIFANDHATNTGILRISKDTGAGGAARLLSTGASLDPIIIDSGNLTLGTAGTSNANLILRGSTSGAVTVQPQAAAGTYNWNLPTTAGASGAFLTSGGGGAAAMTWSSIGTGCATWLATPSSANLAACMTDESGTAGSLVFSIGPALTGTPTAPTAAAGTNTTQIATTAGIVAERSATKTLTNTTYDSDGTGNVMQISGVTVTRGQYPGVNGATDATAGNIGEYVETVVAAGSATSVVTGTAKTIATLNIPSAGDWDVSGTIYFIPAATTSVTRFASSISTTTNSFQSQPGQFADNPIAAFVSAGLSFNASVPTWRVKTSGAQSIFLVSLQTFTVSTMTAYGRISARRAH